MNKKYLVFYDFGVDDVKYFDDKLEAIKFAMNHEGEVAEFNETLKTYYTIWSSYDCFE